LGAHCLDDIQKDRTIIGHSRLCWGVLNIGFLTNRSSNLWFLAAIGGATGYHDRNLVTETDYSFVVTRIIICIQLDLEISIYKFKIGRLKFAYVNFS